MAPVTHVQSGLEQTDTFVVNKNGELTVRWATGKNPWQGPASIGANLFPPSAPLAASIQFGAPQQTDVFGVTKNGKLAVAWVTGTNPWSGPAEIFDGGYEPGAPVAASRQFGIDNQTDLFAVNKNGELTVSWVTGTGNWQGPHSLTHGGYPSKAWVAASQRFGRDTTDVYAVDNEGALTVHSVDGKNPWGGLVRLSPPGTFVPGSPLAAGQQFGLTQTDVFVVDKSGALTVTWFDGSKWQGPERITPSNTFPAGASVATSRQFDRDQTDVFVVDNKGALTVTYVEGAGVWQETQSISHPGFATPSARLTAGRQFGVSQQTDVFVQTGDGQLHVFWVTAGGPWSGPAGI